MTTLNKFDKILIGGEEMKSWTIKDNIKDLHFFLRLSCWNPWDGIEWKKSLRAIRIPFYVEIVIALICVKMEWALNVKEGE